MRTASHSPERLNDFVIKFANVNGTGSASANTLMMKSIFRMGVPVTGKDVRAALEAALGGKPASVNQQPSIGCNIKWKPGNEPDYF